MENPDSAARGYTGIFYAIATKERLLFSFYVFDGRFPFTADKEFCGCFYLCFVGDIGIFFK